MESLNPDLNVCNVVSINEQINYRSIMRLFAPEMIQTSTLYNEIDARPMHDPKESHSIQLKVFRIQVKSVFPRRYSVHKCQIILQAILSTVAI